MQNPVFEITQTFNFESAHFLPDRDGRPEYERVHGHSFVCEVTLKGTRIPELDWVVDLATFQVALDEVAEKLDHDLLNDIEGLETPTMENLAEWIAGRVYRSLRAQSFPNERLELSSIKIIRRELRQACTYHPMKMEFER